MFHTDPTFQWNASTGADTYRLHVSLNSNFVPTVINQGGMTDTSFAATGLTANTLYYWRIRATNAVGDSTWSSRSFTTGSGAASSPPASTPPSAPPSPVPSPSPSQSSSSKYHYSLKNGEKFILWAKLKNESDSEVYSNPGALCRQTPPSSDYNYCVEPRD